MLLCVVLVLAVADTALPALLNGRGQQFHFLSLIFIIVLLSILGTGWFLILKPVVRRLQEDLKKIRSLHEQYRALIEGATDAVVITDEKGVVRDWNPQAEAVFGWSRQAALGRAVDEFIVPERSRARHRDGIRRLIEAGDRSILGRRLSLHALHRDGREIPVEMALTAIPRGETHLFCAFIQDATERLKALEELRHEKEAAQKYLDIADVFIVVLGRNQEIVKINQRGCAVLGRSQENVVGKNAFDHFIPGRLRSSAKKVFDQAMAGQEALPSYLEMPVLVHGHGGERLMAWHNTIVRDDSGAITGTLSSGEDITERKGAERKFFQLYARLEKANRRLEQLALEDSLTELMNRRGLQRVLSREIRWARRQGWSLLAVLVDLDNFKEVNDVHGHAVGNAVLTEVAWRLKSCLRTTDYAARIGGDEFMILLPKTQSLEGVAIAERIRLVLGLTPAVRGSHTVQVTASLGVVEVTDRVPTVDELLSLTHEALRRSKEGGKNRVSYAWSLQGEVLRDPTFKGALEELQRGERLKVVQQSIVSLADEMPVAFELLSRSTVETLEMPDDFFKVCAQLRVLTAVDRQCLMKCLAASKTLPPVARRHVNLFPTTLLATPLADLLALFPAERPAGGFCVEVSGRRMAENVFRLGEVFSALKKHGILTAVDDVGFNPRAIQNLVVLAPDIVKINRECVEGVIRDPEKRQSLQRLVRMAHDLGAQTVIEGIQSREDLAVVKELGVQYGQGYLWGKPVECRRPEQKL